MKTQEAFLLLSILLHSLNANCSSGCLKCNQNNQCLFCDFTKAYQLLDGSCKLNPIENCHLFSTSASCLVCKSGFFLDLQTLQCLKLGSPIQNCQFYSSDMSCLICSPGFFLNQSTCQAATTQIQNCEYYTADKCSSCRDGFLLSPDSTFCRSQEIVENCKEYSFVQCFSCSKSAFLEHEPTKSSIVDAIQSENFSAVFNFLGMKGSFVNRNCVQKTLMNCLEYSSFNSCSKCSDGFYIDSKLKCAENPKGIIPNCETYYKLNHCSSCQQGFYLINQTSCLPVVSVPRCARYDASSTHTACSQCEEGYFLSESNNCQQRQYNIEGCLFFDEKEDRCLVCMEELIVTTDQLACRAYTLNCNDYYESSFDDEELRCRKCEDNYFLSQNVCVKGSIPNCLIYQRTENVCNTCENGFYINKNNQCEQHKIQENCATYDNFIPNKCNECNDFSHLFDASTHCDTFSIPNCIEYHDRTHCSLCEKGFNLTFEEYCEAMPATQTNCLMSQYGICIQCEPGFLIHKGQCVTVFEFQTNDCSRNYLDGFNQDENKICDYCEELSMPQDFKYNFACISEKKFLEATQLVTSLPNCLLHYIGDKGNYQCARCNINFQAQDGACVPQTLPCDLTTSSLFLQNLRIHESTIEMIFKDQCLLREPEDTCSTYGLSSNQENSFQANHECISCNNTSPNEHYKFVNIDEKNFGLVTGNGVEFTGSDQFYWKTKFQCTASATTPVFAENSDQKDKCEYFYELNNEQWGCLRCRAGFSGPIENWSIPNCVAYNDDMSCKRCLPTFYAHAETPFECSLIDTTKEDVIPAHLFNCDPHSFDQEQCHNCSTGFYLDMSQVKYTCQARTPIEMCVDLFLNKDKCLKCDTNFTLSTDQTTCWANADNCTSMSAVDACGKCNDGYILNAGVCTDQQIPDCAETEGEICIIFEQIPIIKKYNCTLSPTISNCDKYNDDGTCNLCLTGYYEFTNPDNSTLCVQNNWEPNGTAASTKLNCKIFKQNESDPAQYKCAECDENYILVYSTDQSEFCFEKNVFIKEVTNVLSTIPSFVSSEINCDVYDYLNRKCLKCLSGFYFQASHCCAIGTYGPSCEFEFSSSSQTLFNSCQEMELINTKDSWKIDCIKCNETSDSPTLSNGRCCPSNTYFNTKDQVCTETNQNCLESSKQNGQCTKCDATRYLQDGTCCLQNEVSIGGECQSTSDMSSSNFTLTECIWLNNKQNYCEKCAEGKIWHLNKCVDAATINCKNYDIFLNECTVCENGYFLTAGQCCKKEGEAQVYDETSRACVNVPVESVKPNCEIHSKVAESFPCQTCKSGFKLANLDADTHCCRPNASITPEGCQDVPEKKFQNCYKMDLINDSCSQCDIGYYYSKNSKCCPQGKFYDSVNDTCENITIANCLETNHEELESCNKCSSHYELKQNDDIFICENIDPSILLISQDLDETPDLDSDLDNDTDIENDLCLYGKIIATDKQSCMPVTLPDSFDRRIVDETLRCRKGSYKVTFNTGASEVVKCVPAYAEHQASYLGYPINENQNYCGVSNRNHLGEQCVKCQTNTLFKSYDNKVSLHQREEGVFYQREDLFADFQNVKLQKTRCCLLGFYESSVPNTCTPIPIKNCGVYDDVTETCSKCINGFKANNNKSACCKLDEVFDLFTHSCLKDTCNTGNYYSNGHCCPNGTFWDKDLKFCNQILVPKCSEASSQFFCSKCLDGFVMRQNGFVFNSNDGKHFADNSQVFATNYCFEETASNVDFQHFKYKESSCLYFDYELKTCSVCKDNFYKTTNSRICCPNNHRLLIKDEIEYCVPIANMLNDCTAFDSSELKCLQCAEGKHLSNGACCQLNEFYNQFTALCQVLTQNCDLADVHSGQCLKCSANFYNSENLCCALEFYAFQGQCLEIGDSIDPENNCEQMKFDQQCTKCKTVDGKKLYLFGGKCCEEGKYYNNIDNSCTAITSSEVGQVSILGLGFNGCLILNNNWECSKCEDGFDLSFHRCCPSGKVWNFDACIEPFYKNCKEHVVIDQVVNQENDPRHFRCLTCKDTFHLTPDNICCLENQFSWKDEETQQYHCTDTAALELDLQSSDNYSNNCVKAYDQNKCVECAEGYLLSLHMAGDLITTACILRTSMTDPSDYLNCTLLSIDKNCLKTNGFEIDLINQPHKPTATAIANCLIVVVNGEESKCSLCKTDYLVTSTGICQIRPFSQCTALDQNGNCSDCNRGFSLNLIGSKLNCTKILSDENFSKAKLTFSGVTNTLTSEIQQCKFTFYLQSTFTFLAKTTSCESLTNKPIENCVYVEKIAFDGMDGYFCQECQSAYKVVNGGRNCCKKASFWNSISQDCQDFNQINPFLVGCETPSNSNTCLKCATNYDMSNGRCCPSTQIFDGVRCIDSESLLILTEDKYCTAYEDQFKCKTCSGERYLSNGHCCLPTMYFSLNEQKCVNISLIRSNCLEFSEGVCIRCESNNYMSKGYCFLELHEIHPQFMIQVKENNQVSRFPKCKKVNRNSESPFNDYCQQCIDDFTLGDNITKTNLCCHGADYIQFYDKETESCKQLTATHCETIEFYQNKCATCVAGHYFTGELCVPLGSYHQKNCSEVKLINTLNEELYPFKDICQQVTVDDMILRKCSNCGEGKFQRDNLCCSIDEFSFHGKCFSQSLFADCKTLDQEGNCTSCTTLTNRVSRGKTVSVCCPEDQYFDGTSCTAHHIEGDSKYIQDCTIYQEGGCSICLANFVSFGNKCCPKNQVLFDNECLSESFVEYCNAYDENEKCTSCYGDRQLSNYRQQQKCCKTNEQFDTHDNKCVVPSEVMADCAWIDFSRQHEPSQRCLSCSDGFYLTNNHCCQEGFEWRLEDSTGPTHEQIERCIEILPENTCLKMDSGVCLQCRDETTHYVHKGHCCANSTFWNGSACAAGNANTNCIKFADCDQQNCIVPQTDACKACQIGSYLTDSLACCPNTHYFNGTQCVDYKANTSDANFHPALSTCEQFSHNSLCFKCASDQAVSQSPKNHCCESSKIIALNVEGKRECLSALTTLDLGCDIFNTTTLLCEKCSANFNFSYQLPEKMTSVCCADGNYFDVQKNLCSPITDLKSDHAPTHYDSCIQFDVENHTCLKCGPNHINLANGQCIPKIKGCARLDKSLKVCLQCEDEATHYLSDGQCCPLGQFWNQTACEIIVTPYSEYKCQGIDAKQCVLCEKGSYLTHGQCCAEGQYYSFGATGHGSPNCITPPVTQNCKLYGSNQNNCLECQDGFLLILLADEKFECISITNGGNCLKPFLQETSTENHLFCGKCEIEASTSIPYLMTTTDINIPIKETLESPEEGCINSSIKDLVSKSSRKCHKFTPFTCASNQFMLEGVCIDIPAHNCESYDPVENLCHKCAEGSRILLNLRESLPVSECEQIEEFTAIAPNKSLGYIPVCSSIPDTVALTTVFKNSPPQLEKFFSIQKCKEDAEIPFAFVNGDFQVNKVKGISRFNTKASLDENLNHRSIKILTSLLATEVFTAGSSNICMPPDLGTVFENKPPEGTALITNCAMALVDVRNPLSFQYNNEQKSDISKLSVFCVACKNGFKPEHNVRLPIHVYNCLPIANCLVDQGEPMVSGCSKCAAGFLWGYDEKGVDYTVCNENHGNNNCLAADAQKNCKFCEKGFSLNPENKCQKIKSFQCKGETSFYTPFQFKDLSLAFNQYTEPFGCNECEAGFLGLFIEKTAFGCVKEETFVSVVNPDCLNWGVLGDKVVCMKCKSDFIITTEHTCIEPVHNNLKNCLIADVTLPAEPHCFQCNENFLPITGACSNKTISGCQSYVLTPMPIETCLKCQDQKYLENNSCFDGKDPQCAQYLNANECKTCVDGSVLIRLDTGVHCIPVNQNFNCLQWNSDHVQLKQLYCEKCQAGTFLEELVVSNQVCIPFIQVDNCIKYKKKSLLIDSSMECELCSSEFYLDNKVCSLRKSISDCEIYDSQADQCTKCLDSHFLSHDQKECHDAPQGVMGCISYQDPETCIKCDKNQFLFNNKCNPISPEDTISNCSFYNPQKECEECSKSYFLMFNKCLPVQVDCKVYFNDQECEICPDGKVLDVVDRKSVCVSYIPIPFCVKYSLLAPVKCLSCLKDYFLNSDLICEAVTKTIPNCSEYKNATSCSQCDEDYVLELFGKACNIYDSTKGSNCLDLKESKSFCSNCKTGFQLSREGACVEMETTVANCLYWKDDTCQFCQPGFYMDSTLTCNL